MLAGGDDGLGDLRREEALQLRRGARAAPTCSATRSSSFAFHSLSVVGLPLHLVLQRLDAQQRAHAREELGLVDRLRQEIVGARLDALDALLVRVERRDQDHRQQRGRRHRRGCAGRRRSRTGPASSRRAARGRASSAASFASASSPFAAVATRVALDRQQVGEQLDVVRRVVDDEHLRRARVIGSRPRSSMRCAPCRGIP